MDVAWLGQTRARASSKFKGWWENCLIREFHPRAHTREFSLARGVCIVVRFVSLEFALCLPSQLSLPPVPRFLSFIINFFFLHRLIAVLSLKRFCAYSLLFIYFLLSSLILSSLPFSLPPSPTFTAHILDLTSSHYCPTNHNALCFVGLYSIPGTPAPQRKANVHTTERIASLGRVENFASDCNFPPQPFVRLMC